MTRKSRKKEQPQRCSKTKKEQGASPALKIVSTLFPRKIRFDLD
jgi:hypothetical protein